MKLLFLILFSFVFMRSFGQDIKSTPEGKADTLTDKSTSVRFILDSSRRYITAIDTLGNQLWKVNPWEDGVLCRMDNDDNYNKIFGIDFIWDWDFTIDNYYCKEAIGFETENSWFGYISKETGRVFVRGKD